MNDYNFNDFEIPDLNIKDPVLQSILNPILDIMQDIDDVNNIWENPTQLAAMMNTLEQSLSMIFIILPQESELRDSLERLNDFIQKIKDDNYVIDPDEYTDILTDLLDCLQNMSLSDEINNDANDIKSTLDRVLKEKNISSVIIDDVTAVKNIQSFELPLFIQETSSLIKSNEAQGFFMAKIENLNTQTINDISMIVDKVIGD